MPSVFKLARLARLVTMPETRRLAVDVVRSGAVVTQAESAIGALE